MFHEGFGAEGEGLKTTASHETQKTSTLARYCICE